MRRSLFRLFLFCSCVFGFFSAEIYGEEIAFEKLTLSEEFHSEGLAIADIDKDGVDDIVSGPYWYRGPSFMKRIRYASGMPLPIVGYSHHFFTWANDFNGDGHVDILTVGMPGTAAYWFENPGKGLLASPLWIKRKAYDEISNESPELVNIVGDSKPELVCLHQGAYCCIQYTVQDGKVTFRHRPMTRNLGYGRFTHGLGIGDVNGDGKPDLLETNGWWQQQKPNELFHFHPFRFAQSGGAQMFAYDFDGDGDNDIICSQNAHGYGLKWFEQVKSDGKIDFIARTIMTDKPKDHPLGLAVSQLHAAGLYDIDGDGIKDFVTGKRFWAHGGHDPGSKELPLLFWLKTVRKQGRVIFEPRLIDVRSGVGTQVTIGDVNRDGKPDIGVASKLGTFLFLQNEKAKPIAWEDQPLTAGTGLFQENVRTTDPLRPEDQQKTFVLPPGFEIQLVAAEPDIAKPMNMAFGRRGRLWVSSSVEYPFAAKPGAKARDAIKILEDTNGDGRANKVITFAEGLNIPMGLLPYGDGVICFSIPNIWYLRDTDGDDKVDKRELLYGPFDTERDTHGMCSSFTWGLDGWIYACHGFNNQSKVKGRDGHEVSLNSGNVFRFRPDGSRIEIVSHGQVNPFGMTIDSNGDIFTADCHTKPINLILRGGHHDSFGKPHDGLGYIPNVMEHLHDSTGIGGIALGEYTSFPTVYQKSTFGGNVVTGRINRNQLIYSGSSMTAREEADFLVPGDPWFRPVNLQVGPDGALYVADFYNRIIGHYEVDLEHPGRDRHRGRIWKIIYKGDSGRRDPQATTFGFKNETKDSDDLFEQMGRLKNANRTEANAILARIAHQSANDKSYLERFTSTARRLSRLEYKNVAYWLSVLFKRHGLMDSKQLSELASIEFDRVRSLAFQLLADYPNEQFEANELESLLRRGLQDKSPFVRRSAVLASSQHPTIDLSTELVVELARARNSNDRYLVHAIRIALREQFKANPGRLTAATGKLDESNLGDFAAVCMTTKSAEAAVFIVDHLEVLATQNPNQLAPYLEFAAKHADVKSIDSIVNIARRRFANDQEFQLAILNSLRTGIQQQGRPMPMSMKKLALSITNELLRLPAKEWQLISSVPANPFTTRRVASADGGEDYFIDTLSRGESQTGILRSQRFQLGDSFEFQIAGHHSGSSDKSKQNFVRLVLAEKDELIAQVPVPGSDIAKPIKLNTRRHHGEQAYLEVVDQVDADSFAWIAVGKFESTPDLNPGKSWHVDPESDALRWSYFESETASAPAPDKSVFVATARRNSADGMKNTPLWSSIVKGEQRTGVYRSEPFKVGPRFSFYLAGHDGYPDKPSNEQNYVQLRLIGSGQVIRKAYPPRNDTAQQITWDLEKWSGQQVQIELVDRDTAGAFAWLAAGRFSVAGLNPTKQNGERQLAAQLISQFKLFETRPDVLRLLALTRSRRLKSEFCKCLIELSPQNVQGRSVFDAVADLVGQAKFDEQVNASGLLAIRNLDGQMARATILKALQQMSAAEQSKIAERLASDQVGAEYLIELVDSGVMTKTVLRNPATAEKVKASAAPALINRLNLLVEQIPKLDPALQDRMVKQKQSFASAQFDLGNGRKIFEKNCASCHRLGQIGTQVGPNLDGMGNRGVDRLVEDILLPNRNVDMAFRASIIATFDGRMINGFVKSAADDSVKNLAVVDHQGKLKLVPKEEIEKIKKTKNSPMPANFAETIPLRDLTDLIAYLMSNPK